MPFPAEWFTGPLEPNLSEGEVHVWRARLDLPLDIRSAYERILSQDELERAGRYKFDRDRFAYIIRRGILRSLVARYLNCLPEEVAFYFDRFGKPWISEALFTDPVQFNLSHSKDWSLFAFCSHHRIGIDIERSREDFDVLGIARSFFSPAEQNELARLPESLRPPGFYNCWTRKEAFIKAHGEGLSLPLDQFDVSLNPGEKARLLTTRGDLEPAGEWTLLDFDPTPGYFAALAVHTGDPEVYFYEVCSKSCVLDWFEDKKFRKEN
jgi:4'-phosphopantetheinyl transferase